MKLYISQSDNTFLWTDNLPIELDAKVHSQFTDFINQSIKLHGPMRPFRLRTFDPNEQQTIIELVFRLLDNGHYYIARVELLHYDNDDVLETDLMAGYHHEDKLWASMLRVEREYGHPEDFVANVLQRFNDYAKTEQPFGKFVNGEQHDNVMKDIYEGRTDGANSYV